MELISLPVIVFRGVDDFRDKAFRGMTANKTACASSMEGRSINAAFGVAVGCHVPGIHPTELTDFSGLDQLLEPQKVAVQGFLGRRLHTVHRESG